jgi:hypothetical protein
LTAAVIIVPLVIAIVVTAWSLEQVRYRPKKRRPTAAARQELQDAGQGAASKTEKEPG